MIRGEGRGKEERRLYKMSLRKVWLVDINIKSISILKSINLCMTFWFMFCNNDVAFIYSLEKIKRLTYLQNSQMSIIHIFPWSHNYLLFYFHLWSWSEEQVYVWSCAHTFHGVHIYKGYIIIFGVSCCLHNPGWLNSPCTLD